MAPPNPAETDDWTLVLETQRGRNAAFDELVRRHAGEAFRFSMRLTGNAADADDLSQEGFERAFRSMDRFRGASTFRSWLFAILVNCHRDALRRRQRRSGRPEVTPAEVPEASGGVAELKAAVDEKIERLPARQREVLTLHLEGKMDYGQIAAALGISRDDVKVNLSLARRRMREELKEFLT